MPRSWRTFPPIIGFIVACQLLVAQESHVHSAPAKLGEVSFQTSCKPALKTEFNRAVALLHSFAYSEAEKTFSGVAQQDPSCAMAHWGIAMTHFHQLWQPPVPPGTGAAAQAQIQQAQRMGASTDREREFIQAVGLIFQDEATVPYATRAVNYERAMAEVAAGNRNDVEAQVFYALALLANASPSDKTHARQKQAADILEPLYAAHPQHPGIAHYLIHACDNAELARRGVPIARAYSKIAPSVPHALHMPSHIFTRLGMWEDSIASNDAARDAAKRADDTGEELHAMDYLVYAYLQLGREAEAAQVIQQLKSMPNLNNADFKASYSATAMPVRYMLERGDWANAAGVGALAGAPPHVTAISVWAQGLGLARSGQANESKQIDELQKLEEQLKNSGNSYWATQVRVQKREVMAWSAQANNKPDEAVALMRQAADEEDSLEKLPVTPGPIIPAREQLGDLLLQQSQWSAAAKEFQTAAANAPGRRGANEGAAEAAKRLRAEKNGQ